ncbi:MAG TPA: YuzD family protein [Bacillota bacterium]|nr:YuzD family protein [Bacillota bacterium]
MSDKKVTLTVYGAEHICPSCVGAPGSKDTYEWLQAAIGRKYIDDVITYEYVDIEEEQTDEDHRQFVEKVYEEDLFYPVILINGELVAEGITQLKDVYQALDKHGVALQ